MNIPQQNQMFQGTFDWSIDSLTLKYNNVTEKVWLSGCYR